MEQRIISLLVCSWGNETIAVHTFNCQAINFGFILISDKILSTFYGGTLI